MNNKISKNSNEEISKTFNVVANTQNWQTLYNEIKNFTSPIVSDKKIILDILLSCEEIFVNISSYAYPKSEGTVFINMKYFPQNNLMSILFEDTGTPFDPVKKTDPNIKIPPKERKIGGLGIYMVKRLMDTMQYQYKNGKNTLLITKKLL